MILAGISIATLTGQNGILTRAESANIENTTGKETEEIGLAYNGAKIIKSGGEITAENLNSEFTINGTKATASGSNPIKVTYSETGNEYTIDESGQIVKLLKPGETATSTVKNNYNDGTISQTNTATIPKGFTVSNKDGEKTIDGGLVVIASDKSEFVWVPVSTVISDTEANARTNKAMAIADGENYRGLLYDFTSSGSTVISGCTTITAETREPDVVTEYDNNKSYLNIINGILGTSLTDSTELKTQLQEEYNKMIESVKKYGGFYVGRYESSLDAKNEIQSKYNVLPTKADNTFTETCYGLYAKQKTYSTESVQGSMIWGSQYDAILNWALKGADKSRVTAKTNANHSMSSVINTGTTSNDKINNIYDLEGNLNEWTLEAYQNKYRTLRGGKYDYAASPSVRVASSPNYASSDFGSRITLYIK